MTVGPSIRSALASRSSDLKPVVSPLILWRRHQEEVAVVRGAFDPIPVEQRMIQPRQPAEDEKRDESCDGRGEHADFERHEQKDRPAVERPSAESIG